MGLGRIHATPLMGHGSAPEIVRRPDLYVVIAQPEKIDLPHDSDSLPALLTELRETGCGLPPEAEGWRREGDSNPRHLSVNALSRRAP